MLNTHSDLPATIPCWVNSRVFHDMDPTHASYPVPCVWVGVSSYPDEEPTCRVLIEGCGVFDYVPIWSILWRLDGRPTDRSRVPFPCPDGAFTVDRSEHLAALPWQCTDTGERMDYLATVDWRHDNRLAHIMRCDCGGFAFVPSYRMIAHGRRLSFRPQKLRQTWRYTERSER
jgi:hypothetical protein